MPFPDLVSISVSDQTKEHLVKRNRPAIFTHHQLKKGSGIKDRVWKTYQNGIFAHHDR